MKQPHKVQERTFNYLVGKAANTEYGQKNNFSKVNSFEDYQRLVPLNEYDDVEEDIRRMMDGAFMFCGQDL